VVRREGLSEVSTHAAIEVQDVWKSFSIPHQNRTSIKEHFLHPLTRTTYETQHALRGVSLAVAQGEFFGIVGGNGSGKSTLLKVVAQIYRHDQGNVLVNGRLSPFIELGVGFNPELTARDNVQINAALLGLSRSETRDRFDEIIAFSELGRFVDQKLKNFSSGMQVRLAYSIAIQVDFDILLLDEVLAVGDEHFQAKCFTTFERFRAEGKTVVLVTHDLSSVNRFCDRVLWIDQGEARMTGPAADVTAAYRRHALEDPANPIALDDAVPHA
jgi:ABC-type polysaccharide/polyol phosphate transport system ATPase subunit